MNTRKICYRCLIEDLDDSKLAEAVKEMIDNISSEFRTPIEEYDRRLKICRECESLVSGTCVKCGCYIELRAAGKDQRCPDPKNKWKNTESYGD